MLYLASKTVSGFSEGGIQGALKMLPKRSAGSGSGSQRGVHAALITVARLLCCLTPCRWLPCL
jgi:hypothetical protein